jgi:hypothetical protein
MSLMMSSCCTFRLNRRSALSIDSPSWILTSATLTTPLQFEAQRITFTCVTLSQVSADSRPKPLQRQRNTRGCSRPMCNVGAYPKSLFQ